MALSAIVGVLGAASLHQQHKAGKEQQKQQDRALKQQEAAQSQATRQAQGAAVQERMSEAALRKKKPDVSSLLGSERSRMGQGPGATMLTGAGGSRGGQMALGRRGSLMGGY